MVAPLRLKPPTDFGFMKFYLGTLVASILTCGGEGKALEEHRLTIKQDSVFPINITGYTSIYLDDSQSLSAEEANKQTFAPAGQPPFKRLSSRTNIWLKISIDHEGATSQTLKLSTSAIYNRKFQVFENTDQGLIQVGTPFSFYRPVVSLAIAPGNHDYLILLTNYNNFFELNLDTEQSLWNQGSVSNFVLGIAFGIIFTIFHLSLGIWTRKKDSAVFFYLLYIHGILLTSLINSGLVRYMFAGETLTWVTYQAGTAFASLMLFALAKTLIHLLDVKKASMILFYSLESLTYIFLGIAVLAFASDHPQINAVLRIFSSLLLLAGLISLLLPRQEPAEGQRLLTLGWLIMIFSAVVYLLTIENIIPRLPFSNFIFILGSCVQIVCFASVLLKRQNNLIKASALAKQELRLKTQEAEQHRRMVDIEKERSESLTSLIHVFSHDLRNPLTSIIGFTELLLVDAIGKEERSDIYQRVLRSANLMEGIIRMVNTQEAIRLNLRQLTVSPVSLKQAIEDTLAIFQSKLENKNIKCHINGLQQLSSDTVMVDGTALSVCVFSNIISNATKFSTPKSKINWNISEEGNFIRVSIEDFGVGITDRQIQQVNQGQGLTSTSGTSGEAGTGFGIQQVQRYIALMGGKMEVSKSCDDPDYPGLTVHIYLLKNQKA